MSTWRSYFPRGIRSGAGLQRPRALLIDGTPLGLIGAEMAERLFRKAGIAATSMGGRGRVNGAQFLRMVFSNESVERLRGIGGKVKAAIER